MTTYSIDTEARHHAYYTIAAASIGASYAVPVILGSVHGLEVAAPSAGAIFGLLFWLFDHYFWKLPFISNIVGIPNLNGEWHGMVYRPAGQVEIPAVVTITQTFLSMSIVLETQQTRSKSVVVGMFAEDPQSITLHYIYVAVRTQGYNAGTPYSQGTNELYLKRQDSGNTLTGPYYSSNSRNGHVEIALLPSAKG